MSWKGSTLGDAIHFDAAGGTAIPASGSNSAQLLAATSKEVSSIWISSSVATPFYITVGPAGNEENLILIPGYSSQIVALEREVTVSKGVRIGIRNFANSAVSSGLVTINFWS